MTDFTRQLFDVSGRVTAVTGGGGHVCGEMARGLGKAGARVAVLDIRLEKAAAVARDINAAGGNAIEVELDATSKASFERAVAEINTKFGPIEIAINGAGINSPKPFLEIDEENWDAVIRSQITSTLFGCQVFGAQMLQWGKGSIINISSASSGPPLSKAFAYSVAKSGIKNLTQNLGREWGTTGVRVNAIRPGFFPTEWNRKNFITPEREKAILDHTPMGRYGETSELIGATIWLASDASSFVTGAEIEVDGGFSCMTI